MKRKILIALGCIVLLGLAAAGAFAAYLFGRGGPIGSTGLKVILQALQSSFTRGEPMRFRVIIQNKKTAESWPSHVEDLKRVLEVK